MNILKTIRRRKPTTVDEFEDVLGLDLLPLDSGAFREVYNISGTRLVVKIPIKGDGNVTHSRREIRRIRQVLRRKNLTYVRRYVPKVYYVDYKNGILIVEQLQKIGKITRATEDVICHLLEDTFPCINNDSDADSKNLGLDGRGQIKVLDWGCV